MFPLSSVQVTAYLHLMSTILFHTVIGLLSFVRALDAGRNRAYLNFLQRRCEVRIKREGICGVDVAAVRALLQDLPFRARKRLQIALQLDVGYASGRFDLLDVSSAHILGFAL